MDGRRDLGRGAVWQGRRDRVEEEESSRLGLTRRAAAGQQPQDAGAEPTPGLARRRQH